MVKEYQGFKIDEKEMEFISSITPYLIEPIQIFLPNAGNAINFGFIQEEHIIELRLRGTYDRIPETITNLTKIKRLSLSSMNLTGFPEILAKIGSLEFLSIIFFNTIKIQYGRKN